MVEGNFIIWNKKEPGEHSAKENRAQKERLLQLYGKYDQAELGQAESRKEVPGAEMGRGGGGCFPREPKF